MILAKQQYHSHLFPLHINQVAHISHYDTLRTNCKVSLRTKIFAKYKDRTRYFCTSIKAINQSDSRQIELAATDWGWQGLLPALPAALDPSTTTQVHHHASILKSSKNQVDCVRAWKTGAHISGIIALRLTGCVGWKDASACGIRSLNGPRGRHAAVQEVVKFLNGRWQHYLLNSTMIAMCRFGTAPNRRVAPGNSYTPHFTNPRS